jgi:hypothetical protein
MNHINYPNNNTPNDTSKPNHSSQTKFDPSLNKGDRGYYGNDNKTSYYPNSNRISDSDKRPPNSNLPEQ